MKKLVPILLVFVALPSCRQVLGIEKATASLEEDTGPASGGSSSAGQPSNGGSAGATPEDDDRGSGGMGGAPVVAPPSTCEVYCEDMELFCTGDAMQYVNFDQCLATCNLYEEGAVGEHGNTQSCRLKYAGKGRYTAGTERAVSCRQAGPAGDGVCGSMCQGYCTAVMAACTPEVTSLYYYETFDHCLEECSNLPAPADVPYSVSDPAVFDGGHVQCRLFHALSALMLDAEEHCEHALGVTLCELTE